MNGQDAETAVETPRSYSRDSGRNLRKVECSEHPTDTAKRDNSNQEIASLMEAVLERENIKKAHKAVEKEHVEASGRKQCTSPIRTYTLKKWDSYH